jgi:hypothetical protein
MPSNKTAHATSLEASRSSGFVSEMRRAIRTGGYYTVRIHAAGDFESPEAVRRWAQIARDNSQTDFYAYTRSWREASILPELVELAKLGNVWLWFSEDRDSGPSPPTGRVRRAFLLLDETDAALIDPGMDLIFRHKTKIPAKRLGGIQVCPYEDGVTRKMGKIKCTQCKICFSAPKPASRSR